MAGFSRQVGNTGKRRNFSYEQFLLFPHCFKRPILQTSKNMGLCGKGLRGSDDILIGSLPKPYVVGTHSLLKLRYSLLISNVSVLTFYHTIMTFTSEKRTF